MSALVWLRARLASLLLIVLLAAAALFGAACSGRHETAAGGPSAKPASTRDSVAHSPSGEVSIPAHNGHRRSRCGACHTLEDRAKPRWKEVAIELGHDVEGQLQERSTCDCCHLGEVKGFGEPFEARCLDCHDDIKVTIPKMASQHCVGCHRLGPGDASDLIVRAWECQGCHADKQGTSAAIDVHGGEDCETCHHPHQEPWTVQRECTECHAREDHVRHGKVEAGRPTPLCTDCHAPHEKAGAASAKCASCHKEKNPEIVAAALFPGHDACTNCHAPHAFDRADAKDCSSCHKQRTMSGKGEKEHSACVNCHSPHDVKGAPEKACSKCHDKVRSTHPDPKGAGCVTCHSPHPGEAATGSAAVLAAAGCATCHSNARTQAGKHGDLSCNKCHQKHDEAAPPVGCASCHQAEASRVAQQPKHSECTGCHTGKGHRPQTNLGACSACHDAEVKSAPKGHSECTKCHDSHSGKKLQAASACKNCHAAEAAGTAALDAHTECANCHRPHGPNGPAAPPSCTTCHEPKKLIGLHADNGHQTCGSCHNSAHAAPKSDRATCVGCHANEKDHQPDAATCAGCHRFAGN